MDKKIIIIISFLSIAVLLAVFLHLFFTRPLFASKVFEFCKFIDLRKTLPKGHFQKVSIVSVTPISGSKDYEQIIFEVPAEKVKEFEAGFRKYVQSAMPLKGTLCCLPNELRMQADNGKYFAYINYDDYGVTIYRRSLFHRGFSSGELRKVFHDAGLKYDSEKQPAQEIEKEANQP